MRKIVSVILAVSLFATLFAGLSVSAAYDATYVFKMSEVKSYHSMNHIKTPAPSADGAYVTYVSNDDASDPYFMFNVGTIPSEYSIMTVRYAATVSLHGTTYVNNGSDYVPSASGHGMTANGQWMWKSYDITKDFSNLTGNVKYARLPGATKGGTIHVAYVGFFKTLQEAKDYDYDYVTTNKLGMLGDHTGSTNLFRINSDGLILDGASQAGSNLNNTNNKIEYKTAYTVKSSIGIFGWISTPDGIEKLQYSINDGEYKDIATSINVRMDLIGQAYDAGRHAAGFNFSIDLPVDMEDNSTISLRAISKAGDTIDFCTFADVSLEERQTTPPATETTPPAEETTPPAEETTPPAEETTPPAEETAAPTEDVILSSLPVKASATRNERWPITFDKCAYYGGLISIAGVTYETGVSTHARDDDNDPAYVEFDISEYTAQGYKYFSAIFGKDDGNVNGGPDNEPGSPAGVPGTKSGYAVLVDGKVVASGTVEYGQAVQIEVDITGASTLTLQFLTGGDGVSNDCSSYANAKLSTKSGTSAPTEAPENPTTGDNNAVTMFVLVAMIAAAGVSVAVLLKKRSYED